MRRLSRAGFYDVRDDGSLGERLDRAEVDLGGRAWVPLDGDTPAVG
jgi:hypothetical protein